MNPRAVLASSLTFVLLAACGTGTDSPISTTASVPGSATVDYTFDEIGSLDDVVDVVERSANDGFVYVVSRRGIIERWSRDGRTRDVVLDMTSFTTAEGERGLLGIAFRWSGRTWEVFLDYTDIDGNTVVSRREVDARGDFVPSSRPTGSQVLSIDQPYSNHNGGDLVVGPDNMLYVATGDGGSAGDPERRALDPTSLLGKILRIEPTPTGYDVPVDNPFAGDPTARGEIWSLGLRNPWRIAFDGRANLWVADVGQNEWEEINLVASRDGIPGGRGANFGWSAYEGTHRYNDDATAPGAVVPIHEYPHRDGDCSVIGGAPGTDASTPGRGGWYFFGDYCSGRVSAIRVDNGRVTGFETVASDLGHIVSINATSTAVYVLGEGKVRRLVSAVRP